jgi:hypothetical protein
MGRITPPVRLTRGEVKVSDRPHNKAGMTTSESAAGSSDVGESDIFDGIVIFLFLVMSGRPFATRHTGSKYWRASVNNLEFC